MHVLRYILALPAILYAVRLSAQPGDTLAAHTFGEASVNATSNRQPLRLTDSGATRWQTRDMQQMPQILGNANPLRLTQTLPFVQTSSEYDSGLHIQGCATGQNAVGMGETVIYNPAHLLGIFSTFNTSHFPAMDFSTFAEAPSPNRLGGFVNMQLPVDTGGITRGELDAGPISSQGTLRLRTSSRSSLVVSARVAYLNLLYGKWLDFDGSETKYSFGDYNLTYTFAPVRRHTFYVNLYGGHDRVGLDESSHQLTSSLRWHNYAAEGGWIFKDKGRTFKQTLYATGYASRLTWRQEALQAGLHSHVRDYGLSSRFENAMWRAGAEFVYHDIQPQSPEVESSYVIGSVPQDRERSGEIALYANYRKEFARGFTLAPGVRATAYVPPGGGVQWGVDPSLSLSQPVGKYIVCTLRGSVRHQFVQQTGFTSLGLPTEFWFSSRRGRVPQRAESVSLRLSAVGEKKRWVFSVEGFYKRLKHQREYGDDALGVFYGNYSLSRVLLEGRGVNYGMGLQLVKQTGRLTGWVSYTLSRSLRTFPALSPSRHYPSNYDRLHELNLLVSYSLRCGLTLSATAVWSSGTPYTAPLGFYMLNGYVLTYYEEHNGSRLPAYKRVDLSAHYVFRRKSRRSHALNVSLLNAFGFNNISFYRLKFYDGAYAWRPVSFLHKPLPSVSYQLHF